MKKGTFAIAIIFAAVVMFLVYQAERGYSSDTKKEESKSMSKSMPMNSITGEVVDLACYMGMGKSGASHAQCAIKCAKMGIPFGIKTDDGIYVVLFGNKKAKAEYDKIGNQGGKTITVKGMKFEKDGLKAIVVGPAEM